MTVFFPSVGLSGDTIFVFILIGIVAALMASNRVRFDLVALMVVLALMLSGVQTAGEALSGFGSPVVMLVAALLVVGEMLDRTGVAAAMGDWITTSSFWKHLLKRRRSFRVTRRCQFL